MVGEDAETRAIQHQRAPQPALALFELGHQALPMVGDPGRGQHVGLVPPHRLEQVHQRPGLAARLEEDVVDSIPGRLPRHVLGIDIQVAQLFATADARREPQTQLVQ